uniref:HIT domain-containing protein n=1 Tax=Sinocyclocheilus anshuiensis TaxID=1608454 RepID=A0A671QCG4_9TELE
MKMAGEMGTELLHDGSLLSVDIHPGAPHHYLVHVPLVEKLVETGKEILQKNNVTDLNDVRFGFHWPPFCSVTHPHLHVLAPVSQMARKMVMQNIDTFDRIIKLLQRTVGILPVLLK